MGGGRIDVLLAGSRAFFKGLSKHQVEAPSYPRAAPPYIIF